MEFCEVDRFHCCLEPSYINIGYNDEIKGFLSGKPAALDSNLIVPGTDVHNRIQNDIFFVALAAKCDMEKEEEDREGPPRKRRRTSSGSGGGCCGVCLDEFTVGEYVTRMPCFHYFHNQYIAAWLTLNHYCPNCQFEMPVTDDETDVQSDDDR